MSKFCCIYHRDGRPIDLQKQESIATCLSPSNPEAVSCYAENSIAIFSATQSDRTHSSSLVVDSLSDLTLSFDGRIDNRSELSAAIGCLTNSDGELLLRAYQALGSRCLERITGDFAFALWDEKEKSIFCGRDPLGIKPFYYFFDDQTFVCASELSTIIQVSEASLHFYEEMLAQVLGGYIQSTDLTLFKNIFRLKPSHYLSLQDTRLQVSQYWDIRNSPVLLYQSDSEYQEHFYELFKNAVLSCADSESSLGISLSGGLDSSSVMATLLSLQEQGKLTTSEITGLTTVFPGMDCDESKYIQAFASRWNCTTKLLDSELYDQSHYRSQVASSFMLPSFPNANITPELRKEIKKSHIQILLTGMGGDELLCSSRAFQPRNFRNIIDFLSPFCPSSLKKQVKKIFKNATHYAWLSDSLIQHLESTHQSIDISELSLRQQRMYRGLFSGMPVLLRELDVRDASSIGIEIRHPFYNKQLIEFCFMLPDDQIEQNGYNKYILRKKFADLLPQEIAWRKSKADFSHLFPEAFRKARAQDILSSLLLAKKGCLKQKIITQMYRDLEDFYQKSNPHYDLHSYELWQIFGAELLFQELEGVYPQTIQQIEAMIE